MSAADVSLREQQAQLTRDRVLRTVVELLEGGEADELTVPQVAKASGVSLRTVYRHFPTRDELLAAAGDWIAEHVFASTAFPERLEDLPSHLVEGFARFDEHPNLVRAMAASGAGGDVRATRRAQRLAALRTAVGEVTGDLAPAERRQAEAVFGLLCDLRAWVSMRDEAGLSGRSAGEAVAWAAETLAADLRRRNAEAGDA